MLLFSLSLTISLSLFLSACLSSVDTLDIDFTHGQKYEQNKTHVCKTRSRMRAFHFQCNDNSVARGRHLRVPPAAAAATATAVPICRSTCYLSAPQKRSFIIYIELTHTHTQTGTHRYTRKIS